jgi:hypothetical protein
MRLITVNWIDPAKVNARLLELGFPRDVIDAAIGVWLAARNSGTPFHSASYEGTSAYHEGVASLRIEGHPHGLVKHTRNGVELCLCPVTGVAVMLAPGDQWTGDAENPHRKPTTKYKRGPGSQELLTNPQLTMFLPAEEKIEKVKYHVWILLLRPTAEGVAAELSLPAEMGSEKTRAGKIKKTGTITDWHERIFLGTYLTGPRSDQSSRHEDLTPTGEIDVPVKQRQ